MDTIDRRRLLQYAALTGVAVALPGTAFTQTNKGKVLRVSANGDISSFDPLTSNSGEDHVKLFSIYDTLVDADFATIEAKPGLATEWKFVEPKILEMTLRRNVQFHDGTPFNAAAVKFNLDRLMNDPRSALKGDISTLDKVEVVADDKVRLHLKQPDTSFPLILSDRPGMMISPTAAQANANNPNAHPVGTGPMKFVSWRPQESIVYERNEKHWRGKPALDGIYFALLNDLQTGLRSVVTGQNNFIYNLAPQQLQIAKRANNLNTRVDTSLYCQIIAFNKGRTPLNNVKVRQAINFAINRQGFSQATSGGLFDPAFMLLPKQHWAYDPTLEKMYPHDPKKAKALLAEAGYPNGLTLSMIVFNDQQSQQRAEVIIEQFRAVGITVRVVTKSVPDANTLFFTEKQEDLLMNAWTGRPDPSQTYTRMFGAGQRSNVGNLIVPGLDDALTEAGSSDNKDVRKVAFAKVQRMVMENALFAPLVFQSQIVAFDKKVQKYEPTLLGKPRFDGVRIAG